MVTLYRRIHCLSWSWLFAVLSGSCPRLCVRPLLKHAVDSEWWFLATNRSWVYGLCFPGQFNALERAPLAGDAWLVCVYRLARFGTPPGSMTHKIKAPYQSLQARRYSDVAELLSRPHYAS